MKLRVLILGLAVGLLVAGPLLAQGVPKARVSGQVVDSSGGALPGVTVTFESPQMIGSRTTVTDGGGNFNSGPVDPGEYAITFALDGFQTVQRNARLNSNSFSQIDVTLDPGAVTEEIVVTGEAVETISESNVASTTVTREDLEDLPIARTLNSAIALAPGVSTSGPGGNISISGAQSWENLFTLNGVVLNENIRGQAFDLFIEDAIQETTTQQAGVSAEFGRFTGGVVNAVTKSGGNSFEGSLRVNFDNEDWKGDNRLSPEREDVQNETFEATIGGRVVRDHLWFFGAGRDREEVGTGQSNLLNLPYDTANEERRLEGKLTANFGSGHQLQGSYIEIQEDQINVPHGGLSQFLVTIDDGSLDPVRSLPQELQVLNYTGVITQNFFAEAQVSERQFTFEGTGGQDADLITGTPQWDLVNDLIYNESLFCDSTAVPECVPEERDNEAWRAKGSYFLAAGGGSHDISFGAESFTDIRASDNHQSPNDFMIWNFAASEYSTSGVITPLIRNTTQIYYGKILNPTQGTDFTTDSAFVNDRWRLNDQVSFNIGLRYDRVDAINSLGAAVADSDSISPRLGATWDVGGAGKHLLHLNLGNYTGPAAGGIFNDSSPAGSPAEFRYFYQGDIEGNFDSNTFNEIVFDWLFSVCPNVREDPLSCPSSIVRNIDIPGASTVLDTGLETTSADEISIGYQTDIGRFGTFRADLVHREFGNFFVTRRDLSTGTATNENGNTFDLGVVENNDSSLEREYSGLSMQWALRFIDSRLRVGGNVTLSEATGNFNGETGGSGPVTSGTLEYPEYREQRWNSPTGDLGVDQRYRGRGWLIYDVMRGDRHNLTASLLQSFFAGTPYSAISDIDPTSFVNNPGYTSPPTDVDYFFSERGAFTTSGINRTDISLNYGFKFNRFEIFVQPELINVFNNENTDNVNTGVITGAAFNPFTDTPRETTLDGDGNLVDPTANFALGENFGRPTTETDLQDAREFRFSVGFRFNP